MSSKERTRSTLPVSMALGATTGMLAKTVGFPFDLRSALKRDVRQAANQPAGGKAYAYTTNRTRGPKVAPRVTPAARRYVRGRQALHRFWGVPRGRSVAWKPALDAMLGSELLKAIATGMVYIPVYEALQHSLPEKWKKKRAAARRRLRRALGA